MLPALVLTAQSAVTDPVEVHACQPTHWFSRLLCCSTMRVRLELYFPVKRVVFMPPRACHSVPRFPAAVCDDQERLSASARWGRALCGVAPAAPPRLYNAPRPGAAGACPTSAAVRDPRSLWAQQAGSPRSTSRWPQPPAPVRAAAADSLEPRRMDVPLPPSVWPSRAALPPASERDSRPAGRRPSTAARCARGAARQNAAHGGGRCCRLARPVAHRRLPRRPTTPRAAPGRWAQDGAARGRGGPVASRHWDVPCPCAGGAGPAHRGRVGAPSLETLGGQPVAPCS